MKPFAIAIHGGAGTILKSMMTAEKEALYMEALQAAVKAGYMLLQKGGSAVDAVEAAVVSLEDSPLFNAGRGSVFTNSGSHEMDASLMDVWLTQVFLLDVFARYPRWRPHARKRGHSRYAADSGARRSAFARSFR